MMKEVRGKNIDKLMFDYVYRENCGTGCDIMLARGRERERLK